MLKLLKYEFKNSKSLYSLFAFIILLIYIAQFVLIKTEDFSKRVDYIMIVPLVALPVLLGLLASEVVGFHNEVVKGREMILYYTPNSMLKIMGAKLLRAFIAVFLISILINLLNWWVGYIPFVRTLRNTVPDLVGASMWMNAVRLFSVFWNVAIVIGLMSCMYFFTALEAGVSGTPIVKHIIWIVAVITVVFGYIIVMKLFMEIFQLNIVIENDVCLRWGQIAKDPLRRFSSAILPVDSDNSIIALFYQDKNKIVLGIAPIIYNSIVTLVFYPLTVLVMKKKVFS